MNTLEDSKAWLYKSGVFALASIGLLAIAAIFFMMKVNSDSNSKTFNVHGEGEVKVVANKASISATFYSEGKDQKSTTDALAAQSEKMFSALDGLMAFKVERKDVKTESVNLQPKYEACDVNYMSARPTPPCASNPKIIGYTATQYVMISLEKGVDGVEVADKAGKITAVLADLGARDVNGPNWEVDNKSAIAEARELATADAREKAKSIAKSLGMRLGDVVYYNENTGGGQPMPYMAKAMTVDAVAGGNAAEAVQVSAGEDTVTVSVDITYELK